MAKNLISGPIWPLKIFWWVLGASYHHMQFQGKLITQTQENGKKTLIFGLIWAHWAQIWGDCTPPSLMSQVPWYKVEISTRNTTCEIITIDDVFDWVT